MENKQTKRLKRNTIDKYYTKGIVVELCINYIKKHISIDKNDLIIESSPGNGAFITDIKTLSPNYIFYDIQPENVEIIYCVIIMYSKVNLIIST